MDEVARSEAAPPPPVERVVRDGSGASERQELESAFFAHESQLYSFALRATRDHDAAEDAVAEAFLRLLTEWRRGRYPERTGAWLMRVTANVIVTSHRRRAVADRWRQLLQRTTPVTIDDPAVEFVAREAQSELERRLSVLGPDARVALLLSAQGLTSAEIADAIGRSDGATRTLLCRARMRMRELRESQEIEP